MKHWRLAMMALLLASPVPAQAADKGPRPSFCQGVALMSGNLRSRLLQGEALPAAIEGVLDDTGAPPERDGPREFLSSLSGLVEVINLDPLPTQSFVLLSCLDADMFGDEGARSAYKTHLPHYLDGAQLCAKSNSDANGLQQCMIKAFILPAQSQ